MKVLYKKTGQMINTCSLVFAKQIYDKTPGQLFLIWGFKYSIIIYELINFFSEFEFTVVSLKCNLLMFFYDSHYDLINMGWISVFV